jgi:mannose-1-phosphate guanylyltransferase
MLGSRHVNAASSVKMRRFRIAMFGRHSHQDGRLTLHKSALSEYSAERSAIILAGGEGARLNELVRSMVGVDIPKQFCPIFGNKTMLERTQERVALTISPERTFVVVTKTHESFYQPLLARVPPSRLVVQPCNRGTAAAMLYALLKLLAVAPTTPVVTFPSDHYVTDDAAFMRHVDLAFDGVRARPDLLVLLGVTPAGPEVDYGWIEMGKRVTDYFQLFRIKRFWQKPSPEMARKLWQSGCLWNSFVTVARVSTSVDLLMRAIPEVYEAFERVRPTLGAASEAEVLEQVYTEVPSVNMSEQVLANSTKSLAVLPVSGVNWSVLSDPEHVVAAIRHAELHSTEP